MQKRIALIALSLIALPLAAVKVGPSQPQPEQPQPVQPQKTTAICRATKWIGAQPGNLCHWTASTRAWTWTSEKVCLYSTKAATLAKAHKKACIIGTTAAITVPGSIYLIKKLADKKVEAEDQESDSVTIDS